MKQIIQKAIVWGDSILKGVSLDPNGKYRVLENSCPSLVRQESGIEIINHSRFGCTAAKGSQIMRADLDKQLGADVAVIEFGGNDCDFDWAEIARDPQAEHLPKTPVGRFVAEVQQMIDAVRSSGMKPVLTTLPPLEPNRFFATISKGLNAENILKWLGGVFATYRWQESYSNAIAELACRNHCTLVDIRSAFLTERRYEEFICEDGMHPNEKGHRLMARAFGDALRTYAACPATA